MQIKKTDTKPHFFALIVAATTTAAILLLSAADSAHLVTAQSRNSINLTATLERSSNQLTKGFGVKTFEFSTTDKSICPGGACTYAIEKGVLRPNLISPSDHVLEGTIQASTKSGETISKPFPIRIGLINNGNETTNGKITEMLVGSFNFGTNVLLVSHHYKIVNATLVDANTDNPILKLQATYAP